jgi:hypothetical protein
VRNVRFHGNGKKKPWSALETAAGKAGLLFLNYY